jgi:hypothetical protein
MPSKTRVKTIIGKARISKVKHYGTSDEFLKDYP